MLQNIYENLRVHIFSICTVVLLTVLALLGKVNWGYRIKQRNFKKTLVNFFWLIPCIMYFVLFWFKFMGENRHDIQGMLLGFVVCVLCVLAVWIIAPQLDALDEILTRKKASGILRKYMSYDETYIKAHICDDEHEIYEVRDLHNIIQVNDDDVHGLLTGAPTRHRAILAHCFLLRVRGFGMPMQMGFHYCENYPFPVIDMPAWTWEENGNLPKRVTLRLISPPKEESEIGKWVATELSFHSARSVMDSGALREFCYICETSFSSGGKLYPDMAASMKDIVEVHIRSQMR